MDLAVFFSHPQRLVVFNAPKMGSIGLSQKREPFRDHGPAMNILETTQSPKTGSSDGNRLYAFVVSSKFYYSIFIWNNWCSFHPSFKVGNSFFKFLPLDIDFAFLQIVWNKFIQPEAIIRLILHDLGQALWLTRRTSVTRWRSWAARDRYNSWHQQKYGSVGLEDSANSTIWQNGWNMLDTRAFSELANPSVWFDRGPGGGPMEEPCSSRWPCRVHLLFLCVLFYHLIRAHKTHVFTPYLALVSWSTHSWPISVESCETDTNSSGFTCPWQQSVIGRIGIRHDSSI